MSAVELPVQAIGLSRSFGRERAVERVDLEVQPGEIHALVGLNGAGKTTLMRLLLGMLRPDEGQSRILGREATEAGPGVWRRVGHLIERPAAWGELSVEENLRCSALLHGLDVRAARASAERAIAEYELGSWARKRARVLSLGNGQRLGIAAAMIHEPSVVVLDEPANGLDPAGLVFIRDRLRRHAREGASILVSSHHLDEISRMADRITVMHRGRRVGVLDPGAAELEKRFFELVYGADLAMRGGDE